MIEYWHESFRKKSNILDDISLHNHHSLEVQDVIYFYNFIFFIDVSI